MFSKTIKFFQITLNKAKDIKFYVISFRLSLLYSIRYLKPVLSIYRIFIPFIVTPHHISFSQSVQYFSFLLSKLILCKPITKTFTCQLTNMQRGAHKFQIYFISDLTTKVGRQQFLCGINLFLGGLDPRLLGESQSFFVFHLNECVLLSKGTH